MQKDLTLLILHGIGGKAGEHWEQYLHDAAQKLGLQVLMPQLPGGDRPDRKIWNSLITKMLLNIDPGKLIIVGHSLAVPTVLDWLETIDKPLKCLISVSGFAYDYGFELNSYYLKEKEINFTKVKRNLRKAYVLYGDDDPYVTQKALADLALSLQVTPKIYPKGGHLSTRAGFTTFPDLVEIIKNEIN